jgi:hypothetical protein
MSGSGPGFSAEGCVRRSLPRSEGRPSRKQRLGHGERHFAVAPERGLRESLLM